MVYCSQSVTSIRKPARMLSRPAAFSWRAILRRAEKRGKKAVGSPTKLPRTPTGWGPSHPPCLTLHSGACGVRIWLRSLGVDETLPLLSPSHSLSSFPPRDSDNFSTHSEIPRAREVGALTSSLSSLTQWSVHCVCALVCAAQVCIGMSLSSSPPSLLALPFFPTRIRNLRRIFEIPRTRRLGTLTSSLTPHGAVCVVYTHLRQQGV